MRLLCDYRGFAALPHSRNGDYVYKEHMVKELFQRGYLPIAERAQLFFFAIKIGGQDRFD